MATKKKTRKPRKQDIRLSLNQKIIDECSTMLAEGSLRQDCRMALEVPKGTWDAWFHRGRQELRDYESKKIPKTTLKAKLVMACDAAEAKARNKIGKEILESNDMSTKLKYLKMRYPKQYSETNVYVDDDSGEEVKKDLSLHDVLADKLSAFLSK